MVTLCSSSLSAYSVLRPYLIVGIKCGSSVFTEMVAMSVSVDQNPKYLVAKYCNRL